MSITRRLSLLFTNVAGDNVTLSFNNADDEVTSDKVKTLMDTIIANNVIYAKVPMIKKSAKITVSDTTDIDIS